MLWNSICFVNYIVLRRFWQVKMTRRWLSQIDYFFASSVNALHCNMRYLSHVYADDIINIMYVLFTYVHKLLSLKDYRLYRRSYMIRNTYHFCLYVVFASYHIFVNREFLGKTQSISFSLLCSCLSSSFIFSKSIFPPVAA